MPEVVVWLNLNIVNVIKHRCFSIYTGSDQSYLEFQAMLFPAVFFQLGVDIFHQGISFIGCVCMSIFERTKDSSLTPLLPTPLPYNLTHTSIYAQQ